MSVDAIPIDILAQVAAAFLFVAAVAVATEAALGIDARYSQTIHETLCRLDAYLSDDSAQKGS